MARQLAEQSATAVAADSGARWMLQSDSGQNVNRVGLNIATHPHFFSLFELRRTRTGEYLLKDHSGGWLHVAQPERAAAPRKLTVFVPPASSPPPSPPPMAEASERTPDTAAEEKAGAEAAAAAAKASAAAAIAAAQRFLIRKQPSGAYTLKLAGENSYLQEDPTGTGHLLAASGDGAARGRFRLKRVVPPNKYGGQVNPRAGGKEKTFKRRVKRSTVRQGGRDFIVATYHNIGMLDWARLFWDWLLVSGIDRFMLLELDGLTCEAARTLNCSLSVECVTAYDMMLPREYTEIKEAGGLQSWGATALTALELTCIGPRASRRSVQARMPSPPTSSFLGGRCAWWSWSSRKAWTS